MTDDRNSARQKRLRAALRENLKRRKGQIRGRAAGSGGETERPAGRSEADHNQQDIAEAAPKSSADD